MELAVRLNEKMTVKLEVNNQKELWRQLSGLEEVLSNTVCGACKSENTKFRTRTAGEGKKTYEFFEMVCADCSSRLSFGCHQEGDTLFPKRKNDDGAWLDNRGWVKYQKPSNDETPAKGKKKSEDTPF